MKKTNLLICNVLISFILIGCVGIKGIDIPDSYLTNLPDNISLDVPQIYQRDNYSCATTSLAMVMSFYDNTRYDKAEVWSSSGSSIYDVTKQCGNDMNGLKRAAKKYGFSKYEFVSSISIEEVKYLISKNIPVIVNIHDSGNSNYHAIVLTGYDKEGFFLKDPAGQYHKERYDRFRKNWYAHLCSPTSSVYRKSAFILYNEKIK